MALQPENGDAAGNAGCNTNGNPNGTIFEPKPVSFDECAPPVVQAPLPPKQPLNPTPQIVILSDSDPFLAQSRLL